MVGADQLGENVLFNETHFQQIISGNVHYILCHKHVKRDLKETLSGDKQIGKLKAKKKKNTLLVLACMLADKMYVLANKSKTSYSGVKHKPDIAIASSKLYPFNLTGARQYMLTS